jgi:hypothetical protein
LHVEVLQQVNLGKSTYLFWLKILQFFKKTFVSLSSFSRCG